MDFDDLRTLIYHRVPIQVCYALGRPGLKSLDKVRRQSRERLLAMNRSAPKGADYFGSALAAIDAAEAEEAVARDVYGCRAGRDCRVATEQQRRKFEAMIAARLAGRSSPAYETGDRR